MTPSTILDLIISAILGFSTFSIAIGLCNIPTTLSKVLRILFGIISVSTISNVVLILTEPHLYSTNIPLISMLTISSVLFSLGWITYLGWKRIEKLVKVAVTQ